MVRNFVEGVRFTYIIMDCFVQYDIRYAAKTIDNVIVNSQSRQYLLLPHFSLMLPYILHISPLTSSSSSSLLCLVVPLLATELEDNELVVDIVQKPIAIDS